MTELLTQIDSLDETITRFDEEVVHYCVPFESAVELLDTIPGVARRSAESIVAEIGTDMTRFPSSAAVIFGGIFPQNNTPSCRLGWSCSWQS